MILVHLSDCFLVQKMANWVQESQDYREYYSNGDVQSGRYPNRDYYGSTSAPAQHNNLNLQNPTQEYYEESHNRNPVRNNRGTRGRGAERGRFQGRFAGQRRQQHHQLPVEPVPVQVVAPSVNGFTQNPRSYQNFQPSYTDNYEEQWYGRGNPSEETRGRRDPRGHPRRGVRGEGRGFRGNDNWQRNPTRPLTDNANVTLGKKMDHFIHGLGSCNQRGRGAEIS